MRKYAAFTLLELTLYLGITALLVPLLFGFFSRSLTLSKKTMVIKEENMRDIVVIAALRNDLISASMHMYDWHPEKLIFKKRICTVRDTFEEQWIGWEATHKGLKRTQGIWDGLANRWSNKNISIFYCGITSLEIQKESEPLLQKQESLYKGVWLTGRRTNNKEPYKLYFKLRNRKIAL